MLARVAQTFVPEPTWWPNWHGETCAIVACGPSAKTAGVEQLRGKVRVLAIKEAVNLCPWADVVYGCDAPWWRYRRGLPEFKGLKLRWAGNRCDEFPEVRGVKLKQHPREPNKFVDQILMDEIGEIGAGRNSGFQGLNLVLQFGVRRVLLVGFDLNDRGGVHFYGRNNWNGANNPDQDMFDRCIQAFQGNAALLKSMNVDVVNASPQSALTCFAKKSVSQALVDWGLA